MKSHNKNILQAKRLSLLLFIKIFKGIKDQSNLYLNYIKAF